ncbi:MAG: 3D domain-containing protein [Parcubacteria group bacterium]|nr:3D domain-containing protein [Parcubacteria group bacterium]
MIKLLKPNILWLNKATIVVITLVLSLNAPIGKASAFWGYNDVIALINNRPEIRGNLFLVTGGDSLIGVDASPRQKTIKTVLTAYSSTPDQTDDTPFITASNTTVRDGVVAANFLAFGTKVQIPEIFGDKVFTVEDRMAKKHNDKIDIWFPERHLAKKFGVQEAEVIILD